MSAEQNKALVRRFDEEIATRATWVRWTSWSWRTTSTTILGHFPASGPGGTV